MDFAQLHAFELPLLKPLQIELSPFQFFFRLLNVFDNTAIYLLIVAFIWHVKSDKAGLHLLYVLSIGSMLYEKLKLILEQPRPFELMPSLKIVGAIGYGFPSGAATGIMMCFGFLIFMPKTKLLYKILAGILIALVGLTRIYLGAHFPSDVIGGYLVGVLVLLIYRYSIGFLEKTVGTWPKLYQFGIHIAFIGSAVWCLNSKMALMLAITLICAIPMYLWIPKSKGMDKKKYTGGAFAVIGAMLLYLLLKNTSFYLGVFALLGIWLGSNKALFAYLSNKYHKKLKSRR